MLDRHRLALLRSLLVLVAGGLALLTAGPLLAAGSEPVGPHFAEQEAARLSAAIAAEPTSAAAFARLIRLWDQRGQLADPAALQAHLERLAARRDLPPLLRGWVVFHLAAALERIGELAAARTLLAGLGFPPDWRVLGPFEDHGGAGFGEPFSPEAEARHGTPPDAVYTGAEGEIRWRTLPELGALGRIDLTPLFARSDEVLAYLAVAFHLERASDLALRVGSSDGLKMFVDGQPVHDRQLRRAAVFDQEAVPLRLAAGWHRLLFKVAHEEGSWTLFARITAPDGAPLPGLSFSADSSKFMDELDIARPPGGPFVAQPLAMARAEVERRRGARPPSSPARLAEALGVLALLEHRIGPNDRREQRAVALLREAVAHDPRRAELRWLLGEALTDDENARRAAYEAALALDPRAVPVLGALAGFYHERDDVYRAWRADEQLLAVDPGNIQALLHRAARWTALDQPEHTLALLEELHARHPANPAIAEALGRQHALLGDQARALRCFRTALQREHLRFDLRSQVNAILEKRGEVEGMLEQVQAVLRIWPHSLSFHLQLARILAENGRREEAIAHLRRLLATFPDHPLLHETLGRQLLQQGNDGEALASLRTALRLRPQDMELRRYVRRLTPGEESLEQRFALPLARLREIPPPPGARELGAYRPLLLRAVEMHPNGLRTTFTQLTVVVTDAKRLPEFQVVPIVFTPGEDVVELLVAERITPRGEVFRPTRVFTSGPGGKQGGMYLDTATRSVQFSDLQAGDLIHLRYRQDEVGSRNLFGDFFGDMLNLQERIPIGRLLYLLDAPKDRPIVSGGRGIGEPRVQAEGERLVYRWEAADLPALREEPDMPGYLEVGRYLSVSTYGTWQELARWYAELIRPQLVLEAEDAALVRRITAGQRSEPEKIRAVHAWVLRHTRYVGIEFGIHGFKPYPASRILRRGYGDCKDKAALIVTMLAELGIEARLALVRTIDRGRLPPQPPTLWGFNHAIVHVPGHDLWLDGTAEYSGSTELPYHDQGATTLVIDHRRSSGELGETPVLPAAVNCWTTAVQGELAEDGSLQLTVREQVSGQGAARLRREYQDPALRRSRLEKMLALRFPGIQVQKADVERISELDVPPTLTFSARLPHVLRQQEDGPVVPLAIFPSKLAPQLAPASSREHELVLDYPWSEQGEVVLGLPAGLQLAEGAPVTARAVSRFGEYRISAEAEATGRLVVTSALTLPTRRIPPADYQEFRRFLLEIDQIESRLLRLRGPQQPPAGEEARR